MSPQHRPETGRPTTVIRVRFDVPAGVRLTVRDLPLEAPRCGTPWPNRDGTPGHLTRSPASAETQWACGTTVQEGRSP